MFADTDRKHYEKALLRKSDKLLLHFNFDVWADYLKVPQHERFAYTLTVYIPKWK